MRMERGIKDWKGDHIRWPNKSNKCKHELEYLEVKDDSERRDEAVKTETKREILE
jgi:hypothetical protein